MDGLTQLFVQIWLGWKIVGICFGILFWVLIMVWFYFIQRADYDKINLDGKDYYYRTKWYGGGTTAWLYKERILFKKQVSRGIQCSGIRSAARTIVDLNREGKIPWIK